MPWVSMASDLHGSSGSKFISQHRAVFLPAVILMADHAAQRGLAIFEPSLERLQLSSTGHLPPALALPNRPVVSVDVPSDHPVGTCDQAQGPACDNYPHAPVTVSTVARLAR